MSILGYNSTSEESDETIRTEESVDDGTILTTFIVGQAPGNSKMLPAATHLTEVAPTSRLAPFVAKSKRVTRKPKGIKNIDKDEFNDLMEAPLLLQIFREENESPMKFQIRKNLTLILPTLDPLLNELPSPTLVMIGHLYLQKAYYNLTYKQDMEDLISIINNKLIEE